MGSRRGCRIELLLSFLESCDRKELEEQIHSQLHHLLTWRLTAWQLWKYEYGLHLIRTYVTNRIKPCAAAWRLFASISTDFQSRHVHVMF
jgi:hypothetical protein